MRCRGDVRSGASLLDELGVATAGSGARFTTRQEFGLITILNPAPATAAVLPDDLLGLVDVITPNEIEATSLTGVDVSDPAAALAAAEHLRWRGCGACVVTLGAAGCVVSDDGVTGKGASGECASGRGAIARGAQSRHIPGQAVEVVDATAAGDTFNGALAVALAEGRPLESAAHLANLSAAASVSRLGAQPSLPTRDEVNWPVEPNQ